MMKGVMNGTSGTTFEPNGSATRAMVVTMLWRMAGEPAGTLAPQDNATRAQIATLFMRFSQNMAS